MGYDPLLGGGENRINFTSQFGDIAFILAVVALTVTLIAAATHARVPVTAILMVFAGLLAGSYLGTTISDRNGWISAFQAQREILASVATGFSTPASHPPRSTIFVGGVPSDYNGVPVFNGPYQLQAGLALYLHDPTVKGIPVLPGGSLTCVPGTISYTVYGAGAAYGHSLAMNVAVPQRRVAVTDAASCALANQIVAESTGLPIPAP